MTTIMKTQNVGKSEQSVNWPFSIGVRGWPRDHQAYGTALDDARRFLADRDREFLRWSPVDLAAVLRSLRNPKAKRKGGV
ncbi:hypothetical protein [Rhodoblastus acidophilus]|uniref:hypothetical protein n=1 Tax=Rhodoblastus acidophilus TaxID=1074 RepID=UPI001131D965|nr:hypothetical protein [Rhodoblastus acidophilus]